MASRSPDFSRGRIKKGPRSQVTLGEGLVLRTGVGLRRGLGTGVDPPVEPLARRRLSCIRGELVDSKPPRQLDKHSGVRRFVGEDVTYFHLFADQWPANR